MAEHYNPQEIEPKWQGKWDEEGAFTTPDVPGNKPPRPATGGPPLLREEGKTPRQPAEQSIVSRGKHYVLDMFPYPSGDGLHVGHVKGYIATDVYARFKRMQGFEVLHPMGWDAFGLPAENYAIANKVHPRAAVEKNIARFKEQLNKIGFTYDWSREITTTDPNYYKWTQWIFLQLLKKGLALESDELINWCPKDKTGLANEDIENGRCERCGTLVEKKKLRQWVLKITEYADRLLADLEELNWPESIKESQRNWIGRSEGSELEFRITQPSPLPAGGATAGAENSEFSVRVFTTRADTLFGATYLVLAPEHPLVASLLKSKAQISNVTDVERYVRKAAHKTDLMRQEDEKEKTGVPLKGIVAINPANSEEIPVWVADYVLMGYGTGAIMAVPAHDERDREFAKNHSLAIRRVIEPIDAFVDGESDASPKDAEKNWQDQFRAIEEGKIAYAYPGILINSRDFTGMYSEEAKQAVTKKVGGEMKTMYKLRDWVFSRQRYWGEPIPIIHCEKCGVVPVPEEDLPVELPEVENYQPTGTGESPLAAIEEWVNVSCPQCGAAAKRETNTMPQWAGSCWYYLRYLDPDNSEALVDLKKEKAWMPVDMYVGGAEHATRHLIYARFWHKFLFDQGVVSTSEPFQQLKSVGLILGADGRKMSKRWGNVLNPDDVIQKHGADALRVYEMFMGPFENAMPWSEESLVGAERFLRRVWALFNHPTPPPGGAPLLREEGQILMHRTIKRVTEAIEQFRFNTGVAALMEWLNELEALRQAQGKQVDPATAQVFIGLLAPYAPHLAEELWTLQGGEGFVSTIAWPEFDAKLLAQAEVTVPVQVNGKVRGQIKLSADADQATVEAAARELPNVIKYLGAGDVQQVIYVPGRMINFVITTLS